MQSVPREWLDFLRQQFPKDSRIQLTEIGGNPRPISPGSTGKLDYIDDAGQFHVKWDNGCTLALVLGEDRFSVYLPEPQTFKLYMPLTADFYGRDEWGDMSEDGEEWDGHTLMDYEGQILSALVKNRVPEENESGLMRWYGEDDSVDHKVRSAVFTVEVRNRQLWGVAECRVAGELTPEELTILKEYLGGQASDGWGEGFEQRPIEVDGGELYVHLWQPDDWSIQTEQERFAPKVAEGLPELCFSTLRTTGQLICIKRGETGYYPSDWDTGDKEGNVELADELNEDLGVTPIQRQAKTIFEVEISNSGPKSYETATVMKMPASFAEFSDALQKARIKDGSFCKNELTCIHYNGLTHAMIGWNANLYDLNLFAQRLASLTEEQKKGMDALLKIKQNHRVAPIPLNQLINLTYNTDICCFAPRVSNHEELGAFLYANEMLSNEAMALLDTTEEGSGFQERLLELLGEQHQEDHGGVFTDFGYAELGGEIKDIYVCQSNETACFHRSDAPVVLEVRKGFFNDPSYDIVNPQNMQKEDFVKGGTATGPMLDFLAACLRYGVSVCVAGATGSGKTTVAGWLLTTIPDNKRIFTIENGSRELDLVREKDGRVCNSVIHTITRESENAKQNIDQDMLLDMALRYHPDIICVGEMRSAEAYAAQEAARTGHGVLTTIHSNSSQANTSLSVVELFIVLM